jgi:hypothetical protein
MLCSNGYEYNKDGLFVYRRFFNFFFFFLVVINLRVDRDCYLLGKKLWFLVTHMKNNDSFKAFVRFD